MFVFISCYKNKKIWKNIKTMCAKYNVSYVIVVGNPRLKKPKLVKDRLILNCKDTYCELPDKIYKLNLYFLDFFPQSKGYLKIDDDVIFLQNPKPYFNEIKKHNFAGVYPLISTQEDGTWHINRCKGSNWNHKSINITEWSKEYLQYKKPFRILAGGATYYVSIKSINAIKNESIVPQTHVLEDVMISNILAKNRIKAIVPKNISLINDFIVFKNMKIFQMNAN